MITPEEIRKKAERQFRQFLINHCLYSRAFFPLRIPANTGSASTGDLRMRRAGLESLWKQSKNRTGIGYTLETDVATTRKNGDQTIITGIYIENEKDYLSLTRQEKKTDTFRRSIAVLHTTRFPLRQNGSPDIPDINTWIENNVTLLSTPPSDRYTAVPPEPEAYWNSICACTRWFLQNPQSDLYPREIPILVHTKFIEGNIPVIRSLTAFLCGTSTDSLPRMLGLRIPDTLIRFRTASSDDELRAALISNTLPSTETVPLHELALPLADFCRFDFSAVRCVMIVENLLVYLTFPPIPKTLCIFGGGFAASRLAACTFPETVQLRYFGDLDEHGFAILSDFRALFPQVCSFCMDIQTLHTFSAFRGPGAILNRRKRPEHLTPREQAVFDELCVDSSRNRLEQERITQAYIETQAKELLICRSGKKAPQSGFHCL